VVPQSRPRARPHCVACLVPKALNKLLETRPLYSCVSITLDKASDAILSLKPVIFHYKSDPKNTPCFGLIAEEVAAVNPDFSGVR
jgi:hypothetical protein